MKLKRIKKKWYLCHRGDLLRVKSWGEAVALWYNLQGLRLPS